MIFQRPAGSAILAFIPTAWIPNLDDCIHIFGLNPPFWMVLDTCFLLMNSQFLYLGMSQNWVPPIFKALRLNIDISISGPLGPFQARNGPVQVFIPMNDWTKRWLNGDNFCWDYDGFSWHNPILMATSGVLMDLDDKILGLSEILMINLRFWWQNLEIHMQCIHVWIAMGWMTAPEFLTTKSPTSLRFLASPWIWGHQTTCASELIIGM